MQQEAVLTQNSFFDTIPNPMQAARVGAEDQFRVSYQENQVYTASREELILMLYDGALKFIRRGMMALDDSDYPTMNYNILRAQKIIHYLDMLLDMDKGQDVAENLTRLYEYINFRLNECQSQRNRALANEAMELIHTLRQAWQQAFLPSDGE